MFKDILLPIDLEEAELTARAIAVAEELVEKFGAQITALTAIPDFNSPLVASYFPDDTIKKAHEQICTDLQKYVDSHFHHPTKVRCSVGEGSPRKVILSYIEANDIDLVIMPARVNDISKVFLGYNSTYVVQHAPCSVMVVR